MPALLMRISTLAVPLDHLGHHRAHLRRIGHVAGEEAGARGWIAGPVEAHRLGAKRRQVPRCARAQPRIAACDDGDLARRIHALSRPAAPAIRAPSLHDDFNARYF